MKLYNWSSEYLKDWALGDIVVMAPDVEAARAIARSEFERHVMDEHFYMHDSPLDLDKDQRDELESYRLIFESDIVWEPTEIDTHVLFIMGSA